MMVAHSTERRQLAALGPSEGAGERISVPDDLARRCDLAARPCDPPAYGQVGFVGTHPKNKQTSWFNEAQGLACGMWRGQPCVFFSTKRRVFGWSATGSTLVGISKNLPDTRWEARVPQALSRHYAHFGDLDFRPRGTARGDALLFVPLEAKRKIHARRPPVLVVYSLPSRNELRLEGHALLEANGESQGFAAPWIAAWPPNPAYVFTSAYDTDTSAEPLQILMYRDHDPGLGVRLSFERAVPLVDDEGRSVRLRQLNGGEFNAAGDLFLLAQGGPCGPALYGYALARWGERMVFRQTGCHRVQIHLRRGKNEEFEGLTTGSLPIPHGDSHIRGIVANWETFGKTGIFLKHWRVENPEPFEPR